MAYKLIWSPAARDDLHDIVVIIGSMTAKEIVFETIRPFAERLLARGVHRAHDIVFIGRNNPANLTESWYRWTIS